MRFLISTSKNFGQINSEARHFSCIIVYFAQPLFLNLHAINIGPTLQRKSQPVVFLFWELRGLSPISTFMCL